MRIGILAALLLSACGAKQIRPAAGRGPVSQLPITRVVMYQNGIGYFERRGRLDGDVLALQVRPNQVNDLLKSLTVIDAREGRAVSVSLPLEKTGAQSLAELPAQVQAASGVLGLLNVFRGARVELDGDEGRVVGRVLGVEQAGGDEKKDARVTVKTDDSALVVYPVAAIEQLLLLDRTLELGLDKSLDVSLNEGQWKPVSLSIKLAGKTPHELVVSYILEMPLWKPAYRIVTDGDNKPLLQGWAVVDNISGEDWRDVELSLVAGTPMSFIYDLHSPKLVRRVDLTPRDDTVALAPVVERPATQPMPPAATPAPIAEWEKHQKSYARSRRAPTGTGHGASMRASGLMDKLEGQDGDVDSSAPEEPAAPEQLERQWAANVAGTTVGALFRYDLRDPVDVPDRSSTLVSIVNARVPGREVVLFRPELTEGVAKSNPYRAVMFSNDTGFTLEKGPVAIYAQATFVGEGFFERMDVGTTSFLTYSIDSQVNLSKTIASVEENARLRKIVNGIIETQAQSVHRTVYAIENRRSEPVVAFVKSLRRAGATLKAPPKDSVETADAYFLPVTVAAGARAELTAEWVTPVVRRLTVDTDASTQVLNLYLSTGKVPPAVATPLKEILKLKSRLAAIANDEGELNKQAALLNEDQDRVRANLNLLRRTPGNQGLKDSLMQKLGRLEDDLGKLSGKLVRFSEERAELNAKMNVLLSQISLESVE